MFERYTEKARRVIFFARLEASHFQSPTIDTEHLLLGSSANTKVSPIVFRATSPSRSRFAHKSKPRVRCACVRRRAKTCLYPKKVNAS